MNITQILRYSKLKEAVNYSAWKRNTKYMLLSNELYDMVQRLDSNSKLEKKLKLATTLTTSKKTKKILKWLTQNNKVKTLIIMKISVEISAVIDRFEKAEDMWKYLKKMYTASDFNLKYIQFLCLTHHKLEDCFLINDYCLKYQEILVENAVADIMIDDDLIVILFLINLESVYSAWVTAKQSAARVFLSRLEDLIMKLINKKQMKKNAVSVVLIVKNKENDKNNVKYVKFMLKMNTKKDEKEKEKDELCSHCERNIHSEKNCWIKHSKKMLKFVKKTWQNKVKIYGKSMMMTLNLNLNLNSNIKSKKKAFTEDFFYIVLTAQEEICLINTIADMWIADTVISCHMCCDKLAF